MKTRPPKSLFPILLILFFVTASLTLAMPSFAKQASKGIAPKTVWGWCCQNGKILRSTSVQCAKNKGHFFKHKQDAEGYLDAQTPGWCCLDGKVLSMKKGNCLKKKGKFFKDKKEAATYCDLRQTGYCCLDGKVTKMLKADCLKKKGKFFLTPKAARDTCDPLGWCLLKGKVHHLRKSACEKEKGRFFTKKAAADRAARSVSAIAKEKGHKKHAGTAGIVSPGLAGARPYLSVERVYLRKVENYYLVCVDIKNRGRGKLTKEDYNKGTLALRREGSKWRWPLYRVDKKGDLNRGKTVSYATGAIISAPTTVQIYFMHVPGGTKSARLMPPIGAYVKGAKKVPTGAAIPARPMRAARKPGKSDTTPGSGRMMGRKVKPEIKVPDAVPKSLDAGIRILSPTSRAKFYAGETIQIRYRITRPGFSADQITFTVWKRNGGLLRTVTVPWGTNPVSLTLPEDISDVSGTFNVLAIARRDSEEIHGISDEFEIHRNSAQIEFIRPTAGEAAHRGGHLTILYRLSRRVSPGPVTFELHSLTNSTVFASTTVDYTPSAPDAERRRVKTTRRAELSIPHDTPYGDDYFITAVHAKAIGTSDTFGIRAIGEGGPDIRTTWSMRVLSPVHPVVWRYGESHTVRVRVDGTPPPEPQFVLQMMKGTQGIWSYYICENPRELRESWDESTHTYTFRFPSPSFDQLRNAPIDPIGTGFHVKIIDLNSPVEAESPAVISLTERRSAVVTMDTTHRYTGGNRLSINLEIHGAARGPFNIYMVGEGPDSDLRYPVVQNYSIPGCPSITPVSHTLTFVPRIIYMDPMRFHFEVRSLTEPDLQVICEPESFTLHPPTMEFPDLRRRYICSRYDQWYTIRFGVDPSLRTRLRIWLHQLDGSYYREQTQVIGHGNSWEGHACDNDPNKTCFHTSMRLTSGSGRWIEPIPSGTYELVVRLAEREGIVFTSPPFRVEAPSD